MSGTNLATTINSPYPNAVFVGFSTANAVANPNTTLYDLALVNRDLYYAFYTKPGERVMRPDWGCKIWQYFMEQMTPALRDAIVTETIRICNLDSRLTVQNVDVFQLGNGIRVEMSLIYAPWNVVGNFYVNFENTQNVYFNNTGTN
jgi:phage baseplate assembly protein W